MRLVSYAENVVERKIKLDTALKLTQEITRMELPPSKLDLGLLTAEFLEENTNDHKIFQKTNFKTLYLLKKFFTKRCSFIWFW